jgi:hypothetical protein
MSNKRKKIEGLGRVVLVLSCLVGMEKTRAAVAFTPGEGYARAAAVAIDAGGVVAVVPAVVARPAAALVAANDINTVLGAVTARLAQTPIWTDAEAGLFADDLCRAMITIMGTGLEAAVQALGGGPVPPVDAFYQALLDPAGAILRPNVTDLKNFIAHSATEHLRASNVGFTRGVKVLQEAISHPEGPRNAAAINALRGNENDDRLFDSTATLNALVGNNPVTGAVYTAAEARDFARQVAEATQNNRYYMLQVLDLLSGAGVINYADGGVEPPVGGIFALAGGAGVAENIAKISQTIFRDFNSGNRFVSHIKEAMRDANPRTGIWNRLIGVAQNRFTVAHIDQLTNGLNKDTNNTYASLEVQEFTAQILTDMVDGLGGYVGSIQNDFKTIANVGWAVAAAAPAATPEHTASQHITAFINTITVDSIRSVINKLKDSTDKSERDKIIKALVALEKAVSLNAVFNDIPNGAMAAAGFTAQAKLGIEYANYMQANHADPKTSTDLANRLQALEAHLNPAAQPGAAPAQPGAAPAQPDKRPRTFPRRSIIGAGRGSRRGRPMPRRGKRFIRSRGFRQGSRTQFQFQSRGRSRTQFQFQPRGRSNSLPLNLL